MPADLPGVVHHRDRTLLPSLGIVGIVKSSNVSKEYAAGNYARAKDASKQAKTWSIIGLCCGLFWIILYIILLACGFMVGLADL